MAIFKLQDTRERRLYSDSRLSGLPAVEEQRCGADVDYRDICRGAHLPADPLDMGLHRVVDRAGDQNTNPLSWIHRIRESFAKELGMVRGSDRQIESPQILSETMIPRTAFTGLWVKSTGSLSKPAS